MAEGKIGESCTGSVPRYSSLYSRHSRNHVESVSVEVCTIMTRLGYGDLIRRRRIEAYKENDRLLNGNLFNLFNPCRFTIITVGSKAEGLTCIIENDFDYLYVLNGVLCVEAGINPNTIPGNMEVYRMDTRVYPGHCRLFLETQVPSLHPEILNAQCDNGYGAVLLSSGLFVDEWSRFELALTSTFSHEFDGCNIRHKERAGPSLPSTGSEIFHMDKVFALRCHCPSILQRWAARTRHWPSPVIVHKVVSSGAYVTPVGFKGSVYNFIEWRICFNTGETELVNNLNHTHAQVYVLLKMILKYVLKPNHKEITSFVIKNIILWQAENTPQTEFHSRSLLYWLHDGLRELRTAIEKKQLRYYMIPERNLMAACGLDDALQHKWVADITDMLEEGPMVILRLEKIRKAIVASPEPMLWFSKKRMEIEMFLLEFNTRFQLDGSEKAFSDLGSTFEAIILEVEQRILQEGSSLDDLIDLFPRLLM